jgi:hypothetical protein
VQDDFQKRLINHDFTVSLDEPEFPEFVHEEIDARARSAIISARVFAAPAVGWLRASM